MLHTLRHLGAALAVASFAALPGSAWSQAQAAVDMGQAVPDAKAVAEGLFPEDECEQLKAAGFKCMGFRPSMRYSLPASSFKVGSAEIPDSLKSQLEVFADVLRARRGSGKVVRIEGHADASGSATVNTALSQKRAEAVREYLVARGADPAMLSPVGLGSNVPKNGADPFSPENRRVEIGRADAPK
jgi:outer membrane protein OmpA-like peptidoglycan-associated protein